MNSGRLIRVETYPGVALDVGRVLLTIMESLDARHPDVMLVTGQSVTYLHNSLFLLVPSVNL